MKEKTTDLFVFLQHIYRMHPEKYFYHKDDVFESSASECSGHMHHLSRTFEKNTLHVVMISLVAMVLEIGYGYHSGSMALLGDGFHMGSHVFAIGLSWFAYYLARVWSRKNRFRFNRENLLALSGFTSGIVLMYFSVELGMESVHRLLHPENILFREALLVATIGFLVNLVSIRFLHQNHEHHDLNIRSAYLHVLSDIITSVLAILSLMVGYYFNIRRIDGMAGVLSSVVIFYWSIGLLIKSCRAILQFKKIGTDA